MYQTYINRYFSPVNLSRTNNVINSSNILCRNIPIHINYLIKKHIIKYFHLIFRKDLCLKKLAASCRQSKSYLKQRVLERNTASNAYALTYSAYQIKLSMNGVTYVLCLVPFQSL